MRRNQFNPPIQVGERVQLIAGREEYFGLRPDVIYTVDRVDISGDPWVGNACFGTNVCERVSDPRPKTKADKEIAKKEAELARLKEAYAKRAQAAMDRKKKAERAKVLAGLSAAGMRVVAMLKANPGAFGCQAAHALDLVAAITGDKPEAIRKALAYPSPQSQEPRYE